MGSHNWDGPGTPEGARPSPSPDRPPTGAPAPAGSPASDASPQGVVSPQGGGGPEGAGLDTGGWRADEGPTGENRPRRRGPFPPRIAPRFGGPPPNPAPPPPPPAGSPVVGPPVAGPPVGGPPPVSGAGPRPHGHGHGHGHDHGIAGLPRAFIVLAALVAVVLLGICTAAALLDGDDTLPSAAEQAQAGRIEGGDALIGRESLDAVAAAGERLRQGPYQVSFRFARGSSLIRDGEPAPVPVAALTWVGDLRSTGGADPSWDIRSQVTAQGEGGADLGVVDTLAVVEIGGARYLDSAARDDGGLPWTAASGPERATFCWPGPGFRHADGAGLPIPLPVVDPAEYLDITSAAVTIEELPGDVVRYVMPSRAAGPDAPGLMPGDRLAAALRSLAASTGVDIVEYTLAITLSADDNLATVEVTGVGNAQGVTLTLAPYAAGAPVEIIAPPEDQVRR